MEVGPTHLALRIPDRLVHTQDHARGVDSAAQRVGLDQCRLPHKLLHVVLHALAINVHACPDVALRMSHPQLVEQVSGVQTSVVADLTGDDLEGLGHRADDELLLAHDRTRVSAQVLGDLHLA